MLEKLKKTALVLIIAAGLCSCGESGVSGGIPEDTGGAPKIEISKLNSAETELPAETEISAEDTEETAEEPAAKKITDGQGLINRSFYASDENIRPLGRTVFKDNSRYFSFTCSGAEFSFRGTYAGARIFSNGTQRIGIYENGEMKQDIIIEFGITDIELFSSEEPEEREIKIMKLSESKKEYIQIKSIETVSEGDIIPTEKKKLSIEFIGDSITCGYGTDSKDQYENFSVRTEDGSKTYAYLACSELDADISMCAWSGIGVYSAYSGSGAQNKEILIDDIYGSVCVRNEKWDNYAEKYDIVVICLGTNDATFTKRIPEREELFGDAYYAFLSRVREANPDSYIICAHGALEGSLTEEIKAQAEKFSSDRSDEKISFLEFDFQNGSRDGFGADYHPSARTHEIMAEKLTEHIKSLAIK